MIRFKVERAQVLRAKRAGVLDMAHMKLICPFPWDWVLIGS